MTLILSLSDRAETELRQQAAAAGKDVNKYASELLESAVKQAPSSQASATDVGTRSIRERLAPLLQAAWSVRREPRHALRDDEAQVRQLILEKYRRQGLKL